MGLLDILTNHSIFDDSEDLYEIYLQSKKEMKENLEKQRKAQAVQNAIYKIRQNRLKQFEDHQRLEDCIEALEDINLKTSETPQLDRDLLNWLKELKEYRQNNNYIRN